MSNSVQKYILGSNDLGFFLIKIPDCKYLRKDGVFRLGVYSSSIYSKDSGYFRSYRQLMGVARKQGITKKELDLWQGCITSRIFNK